MSINRYRLKHLTDNNHRSAERVSKLLERPDRLIGLILIGNNLVNIAASAIATIIGLRLFGDAGIAIATFTLTFVILVCAEVTPKTLAALYPEKIAYPSSAILSVLLKLLFPFVVATNWITNGILSIFQISAEKREEHNLSSEELRTVVNEAGAMIPKQHQEMLLSILDLEKVTVDDIMIPRAEINAINVNEEWNNLLKKLRKSQHTRILLYRDQIDDALGFIHAKDALQLMSKDKLNKENLIRAVREIYFIPEGTPLNVQLLKFQRNKERIGLVVDEYGDIQGLVALEDILEEIVGDFTTTMTPTPSDEIKQLGGNSYEVDGLANIRDINKELDFELPTDGPKTLNGLILEYLEDIPEENTSIEINDLSIEIVEVADNIVKTAKISPTQEQPAS